MKPADQMFVTNKAILVNPRGEILMIRDAGCDEFHKNAKGFWDLPGGCMENLESPLECLFREVKEEVSIEIDPEKAEIFHYDHWVLDGDEKNGFVLALFYLVPVGEVDVVLSEEHDEMRWMDPKRPVPNDMTGSAVRILELYKKRQNIPELDERIRGRQGYGLIQVYHGNGKGKSTAALGQALRCAGTGKRVAIIYFDKGGIDHYSERAILDQIGNIDYWATGRDRIDPQTGRFDFSIQEIDRQEAQKGLNLAQNHLSSGEYQLVILDEINPTVDLGMLNFDDVLKVIENKRSDVEVILTGRNPHSIFLERAHLVSKVAPEKHYFYSGCQARQGLDY
ncbi:MAG: cob(I)yrinic acid a,c-diamide adenosyltransferase [Patescibacteria group bacterium]